MEFLKIGLRLDPWPADYEAAIQLAEIEKTDARIDITRESARRRQPTGFEAFEGE